MNGSAFDFTNLGTHSSSQMGHVEQRRPASSNARPSFSLLKLLMLILNEKVLSIDLKDSRKGFEKLCDKKTWRRKEESKED